jgi:hypothetical protein
MADEVLTRRALNRALLARQMLLRREKISAVDAVERLAGMQSQAPNPPYVGLWTRLEGFRHEELSQAVRDRAVVRMALMRSTIHLATASDALELRPLVQPVLERGLRSAYGKRLEGLDLAEVAAAGRTLVEEEPRTFAELGAALGERWPGRDPAALAQAVRTFVPLVQVPPRGLWGVSGQAAHTSAEAWLGRPLAAPSAEEMVLRYLAAFGPATVKDAQVWSGISRLREVFAALRPRLCTFRDEDGNELFDLPCAPRPDPGTPAPARFLPEWDNVLLSHAVRTRILADEHRPRVFTVNGIILGTVLLDGFVAGTWKIVRGRGTAALHVEPFAPLSGPDRAAVEEEGAGLLAFAAADARAHAVHLASPAG